MNPVLSSFLGRTEVKVLTRKKRREKREERREEDSVCMYLHESRNTSSVQLLISRVWRQKRTRARGCRVCITRARVLKLGHGAREHLHEKSRRHHVQNFIDNINEKTVFPFVFPRCRFTCRCQQVKQCGTETAVPRAGLRL